MNVINWAIIAVKFNPDIPGIELSKYRYFRIEFLEPGIIYSLDIGILIDEFCELNS